MDWELLTRLGGVVFVNLILSGDNAVVIALAVRRLPGRQRRLAIFWGTAGAVGLRLLFAAVVTFLVGIPFLQAAGGLLLLWIAWKLVNDDAQPAGHVKAGQGLWDAVKIVMVADAVMSLDNVIALVGASGGEFWLLAVGVAMTIPLVVWGASLLSYLLDRFPVLAYAGAGLLVYITVEMVFADRGLAPYLHDYESLAWIIGLGAMLAFIAVAWLWQMVKRGFRRAGRRAEPAPKARQTGLPAEQRRPPDAVGRWR